MSLRARLYRHRSSLHASGTNLENPNARRRAWKYVMIYDHGILRSFWTNFSKVAREVYRANQPSPDRLKTYRDQGIKTILNLRGASANPPYLFAKDACAKLGLHLIDVPSFSARQAPSRDTLQTILNALQTCEKPVLMHCKSGADRTSLAAVVYLLSQGASVDSARKHLSIRFIHFKWTKTGVMDHIVDCFEEAQAKTDCSFQDWLDADYDGAKIQASFDAKRKA
ncbi:MAG: sulfur transferase domain-containing protein [Paracoccaceae bacterium]